MKINAKKTVQIDAVEIRVHNKPVDSGSYTLVDAQGEVIVHHEGYVPSFFPGDHSGDYLILNIDLETGQIKNWKKPTVKQLEAFIVAKGEEDE